MTQNMPGAPSAPTSPDPSLAPAVEVAGLVKTFGPVRAVDGIDLRVAPGEIVAFLGPNGAGKSTALDVILGFSTHLVRFLGETGNNVMMRLMGLILMVIAVECFVGGARPILVEILREGLR